MYKIVFKDGTVYISKKNTTTKEAIRAAHLNANSRSKNIKTLVKL